VGSYEDWVKDLRNVAGEGEESRLTVLAFPEASHFWHGEAGELLQDGVSRWLQGL